MEKKRIFTELSILFKKKHGNEPEHIEPLPQSGSSRSYYKIHSKEIIVLGAYNKNVAENEAFFYMTEYFSKQRLPVPKIHLISKNKMFYLLDFISDDNMLDIVATYRQKKDFISIKALYQKALDFLIRFQLQGKKQFNFDHCYPVKTFDDRIMKWDLNYFKYYFLKIFNITFNEQKLESDFNKLIAFLLKANCSFFMYRDFQARNIMVKQDALFFIDYQGGMKGNLFYDLVSILNQAKADLPTSIKQELIEYYRVQISKEIPGIDANTFSSFYKAFALHRLLQVFGAYGFRGIIERKGHFLQSIPFAQKIAEDYLSEKNKNLLLPELNMVLQQIVDIKIQPALKSQDLLVSLQSFSYKKGLPIDYTEHGGGFIFDCRALENPGRQHKYASLTGKDKAVIDFLESKAEVSTFINKIYEIISQSITRYSQRHFSYISIAFGCTGGQHRSVYCTEKLAKMLSNISNIQIKVSHRELEEQTQS